MISSDMVRKVRTSLREDGIGQTAGRVLNRVVYRTGLGATNTINRRRKALSRLLDDKFESTVQYGPFKGLKLGKSTWWSNGDRSAMLLGIYEQEVLNSLTEASKTHRNFIDLGAADGYYGIGALTSGLFDKSICYEMNTEGRKTIEKNAILNDVIGNVTIRGIAERGFHLDIPREFLDSAVLLIDIEGHEFDLLNHETLSALHNTIILTELHEWLVENGSARLRELYEVAQRTHSLTELTTQGRDPSRFVELRDLSDNDRWLICSEGRPRQMTWLRLDPIRK